jgi:hypothetical protein
LGEDVTDTAVSDVIETGLTMGRYDPGSFTPSEARKLAEFSCAGGALESYGGTPKVGQVLVPAICPTGLKLGENSGLNFIRLSANSVKYWSVYSVNDALSQAQGELTHWCALGERKKDPDPKGRGFVLSFLEHPTLNLRHIRQP